MTDFEQEFKRGGRILPSGRHAILDPTFNRTDSIEDPDSKYELLYPISIHEVSDVPLGLIPIVVPLAITESGKHVFFGICPVYKELKVGFRDPGQQFQIYYFNDPHVEEYLSNDPEIRENVIELRRVVKELFGAA